MAYATANNPQRNLPTLAVVTALHLGAALALINGLAGGIFTPEEDKPFESVFVPSDNKPEPPPPQERSEPARSTQTQKPVATDPPIDLGIADKGPIIDAQPPDGTGGDTLIPTFPIQPPLPPTTPGLKPQGPKARGNSGGWVTTHDYPSRDLHEEHEGVTKVRLEIGASGKVTGCEVVRTSGWPGLDQASCRTLTDRARFDPATDESGAKVTGSFITAVRWQLPKE